MRTLLLAALAAPLLLAGCSAPATAPPVGFDTYDADGDGFVTDDEFYGGFAASPYYAGYDADGDGLINDAEFGATGFGYDYATYDLDGDGYLADDEFYGGVYDTWDADRDGVLDRTEFQTGYDASFGVY